MIIIEGMDNGGKSTLVETLTKEFNLPSIKSYRPRIEADIHQFHNWASACPATIILDRHPAISDLVYGHILRGRSLSTLQIARGCRANNTLIYCRPSNRTILHSLNERTHLAGVTDHSLRLLEEYDLIMDELEPDETYDYTLPRALQALITNLTRTLAKCS